MSASNTIMSTLRKCGSSLASVIGRGTIPQSKKFRKVTSLSNQGEASPASLEKASKPQTPSEKTANVMSHSFEEGYATRADEEGFGKTYDGDKAVNNINADKEIHDNYPDNDKSQGRRGESEGES